MSEKSARPGRPFPILLRFKMPVSTMYWNWIGYAWVAKVVAMYAICSLSSWKAVDTTASFKIRPIIDSSLKNYTSSQNRRFLFLSLPITKLWTARILTRLSSYTHSPTHLRASCTQHINRLDAVQCKLLRRIEQATWSISKHYSYEEP